MKKIIAICLSLCLSLMVFTVPTYAVSTASTEKTDVAIVATETDGIMPRNVTVLKEESNVFFIDSYSIKVTPAK